MRTLVALAAALLSSCAPEIPEGVILCGDEPAGPSCPPRWYCHANMRCYSEPERAIGPGDPSTADDAAAPDAEPDDGDAELARSDGGMTLPGQPTDAATPADDGSFDGSAGVAADGSSPPAADATGPSSDASLSASCAALGGDTACDDGKFCNGLETCAPDSPTADARGCAAGAAVVCPAGQLCTEAQRACTPCREGIPDDADGDGFESVDCGGQDCDDEDAARHPGARELCDGKDNDCDGVTDGDRANAVCAESAPVGGTSSCGAGGCAPRCNDPDHDLLGSACVKHDDCVGVVRCGPGTCNDRIRSYVCTCPAGYAGTGTSACTDVDECATSMHQCDTSPLAACMNTPGSYACMCPPSSTGTGRGPDGCTAAAPTECSTWVASGASGVIPAGAPGYGRLNITGSGAHTQYICRLALPDGTVVPGKANSTPNNGTSFEWGCFGAIYDGASWKEYNAIQIGERFEVFVPPAACRLDWATVPAGGAIPANALRMSVDASGAALYSCMVSVNDAQSQGTHMGRVASAPGSPCVVQYFARVLLFDTFNVLVRL